jgi:hypothetical protein
MLVSQILIINLGITSADSSSQLSRIYPPRVSRLHPEHGIDPRQCCIHPIRRLLLATIFLYRPYWTSMEYHGVFIWLWCMHGNSRWLLVCQVFCDSCRCRCFHFCKPMHSELKTYLALLILLYQLYLDCFTCGILPVSWSYSAEVQPLRVRNKATAVGVFSHWMSNL